MKSYGINDTEMKKHKENPIYRRGFHCAVDAIASILIK